MHCTLTQFYRTTHLLSLDTIQSTSTTLHMHNLLCRSGNNSTQGHLQSCGMVYDPHVHQVLWPRFASHPWLFCSLAIAVPSHTRQGFANLAAWKSHSPSVFRHSLSSRRGTSLVTYITMVPPHMLLSFLVMTSLAPDVSPSIGLITHMIQSLISLKTFP